MRLSPYAIAVPYGADILLFNSMNGSLVHVDSAHCSGGRVDLSGFGPQEISALKNLGFFATHQETLEQVSKSYMQPSRTLVVIVEMTDRCNCSCTYCYQRGWAPRGTVSADNMDAVVQYIDQCTRGGGFDTVRTDFIGGEPLLAADRIITLYERVRDICDSRGIWYKPGIDTNGTLLTPQFLSNFHYLNTSITLSIQEDHDRNRPFANGSGTFATILKNLADCRDAFRSNSRLLLCIRYNTHAGNYTSFGGFLELLSSLELPITRVETQYTNEYPQNSFTNGLTKEEYIWWNSTVALDTLIEHGYKVAYFPPTRLRACKAYLPFNCKVFANGWLGLCDASTCVNGLSIAEAAKDPEAVNRHFSEYKTWNPLQDLECRSCSHIVQCGGRHFCKRNPCDYSNYDLGAYLRRYQRCLDSGLGSLMPVEATPGAL